MTVRLTKFFNIHYKINLSKRHCLKTHLVLPSTPVKTQDLSRPRAVQPLRFATVHNATHIPAKADTGNQNSHALLS